MEILYTEPVVQAVVNDDNNPYADAELHDQRSLRLVRSGSFSTPGVLGSLMKRVFDIVFSLVLMLLGFPVFSLLYLITRFSSRGPAFYSQERNGKNGKPFHIYKFRSMRVDAEQFGPMLSSANDPRITRWGKIMRRSRLDELPQFYNVLIGDMSIVGPRPERQHFIDQIISVNPQYNRLNSLRPGITSMGQVHYGYAEDVAQMCERMEYDLRYLDEASFATDVRLIVKTVGVMVQGKGK